MSGWKATLQVDPEVIKIGDTVARNLSQKILPNALDAAAAAVTPMLVVELPDGTESRRLQLPSSRAKFPLKLKASVRVKKLRPKRNTVLRIVGVLEAAAHAKFDHGEKALYGEGRNHIFWGKRPKPPRLRRQMKDIARIVSVKAEPTVNAIVKKHLEHAVSTGELLKG